MGLTRKLMSLSTLGAVDMRSDKERTAAYTNKSAKEAARLRKAAEAQLRLEQARARRDQVMSGQAPPAPAATPSGPPPSWLVDTEDSTLLRWWDGTRFTEHTQPRP